MSRPPSSDRPTDVPPDLVRVRIFVEGRVQRVWFGRAPGRRPIAWG